MTTLIERLRNRAKAIADLHEIASHLGEFPLDCMMIDSRLESKAADRLWHLEAEINSLRESSIDEVSAAATDLERLIESGRQYRLRCAQSPDERLDIALSAHELATIAFALRQLRQGT